MRKQSFADLSRQMKRLPTPAIWRRRIQRLFWKKRKKKLFNILQRRNNEEYVPIQQVVLNAINNIEKASKLKGSVTGIPTGFMDLDYKTSGMHPSDLVLIAARPSMGKTAFVLNIAQYMAFRKDVTVAIFSLEMSKEQLVNRLLAMESHVDSQNMRTGNLKERGLDKTGRRRRYYR